MIRIESQTRFWFIAFLVFCVVVWLLRPMLLPFLVGAAIAYFLNPVVNLLARRKIRRWLGTTIVMFAFIFGVSALLALITPLLETQLGALINAIPGYVDTFRATYVPWVEGWLARFEPEDIEKIRDAAGQSVGTATGLVGNFFKNIVSGGMALFDIIGLIVITPIVAFYMLRDWPKMVKAIDSLFPRRYYDVIKAQLKAIDETLSGFIRGQALVCLALGLIYSVGLTAAGLKYGAVIGIMAGVLSFIPFVGTTFGWVTSVILALVQFNHDLSRVGFVIAVFVVGQALEGYVLSPRLVGERVGLHPLWIMFALLAGGALMGFTGVLIAVPAAAVIGVLIRFGIHQYKTSKVYKDGL